MSDETKSSDGFKAELVTVPAEATNEGQHVFTFVGHDDSLRKVESVEWKKVYLIFDTVDEEGFGHAHDSKRPDEHFLVAMEPDLEARLHSGVEFLAKVNRTHFVTEVLE